MAGHADKPALYGINPYKGFNIILTGLSTDFVDNISGIKKFERHKTLAIIGLLWF